MTDAFATLGLPRRAALNTEALQNAYAVHSRTAHPDHGGNEAAAADLNAAYEILRAPEKRLKHLLELAAPEDAKKWRTVPLDDGMMKLFSELGTALDSSARFIERKSKSQTALARALLANEEMKQRESLEQLGFEIERRRNEFESQLSAAESDWAKLAAMQAKFAYLTKWQTQVRERLLPLM